MTSIVYHVKHMNLQITCADCRQCESNSEYKGNKHILNTVISVIYAII